MQSHQKSVNSKEQLNSTMEGQQSVSQESQQQQQLEPPHIEDLPEKKAMAGRWILGADGEKLFFVVQENLPPIPKQVIPLPPPPSDCGSAYHSDSSLTFSQYTMEANAPDTASAHSQIIESDHEGDEADEIHDKDHEIVGPFFKGIITDKTTNSLGTDGKRSKGSKTIETTDLSEVDLEGQGYPRGIFRPGTLAGSQDGKGNNPRRKITFVEPSKTWKEEKAELRRGRQRERCFRRAVFICVFMSMLTLVVGGGLSAMVYFEVIDIESLNLDFLKPKPATTTYTNLPDTDDIFGTPLATSSPTFFDSTTDFPTPSPTPSGPTAPPTVSNEGSFITDTLSGQFRIEISPDDPSAPANQAVAWMTEELKSVSKGLVDYQYDNLGKFGQRFALLATQYSLRGKKNSKPSSLFPLQEQMGVDECDWDGVGCDDYGRVIEVDFSDLGLTGEIPSEIRYLFKLEILDVSSNGITGSIPKEIYDLRNLKKLYLYQNELTGTISTWIGQLGSLEYLHLSHNSLVGSIPEELRSYSDSVLNPLIYLNLYSNRLTGTIPNNLNLGKLFYFDVGRNFISGTIPKDIGDDYEDLKYLHIDHNQISGSIPDTIPLMADGRMISFLANHNRLTGSVPDNWLMYNKLVQYTLHNNYFDALGPKNCNMNVFAGGQCVEFKADCYICSCDDIFCDAMCNTGNLL